MRAAIVDQDQCLMDMVMQYGGTVTDLLIIAQLNGISPTDDVAAGLNMSLPDEPGNANIVAYLAQQKVIPATKNIEIQPAGTGVWPGFESFKKFSEKGKAIVDQDQCLMDMVMQYGGTVTDLLIIAQLNGISPTDDIETGLAMSLPDEPGNANIVAYLLQQKVIPATKTTAINPDFEGIGYWFVEADFIVQ